MDGTKKYETLFACRWYWNIMTLPMCCTKMFLILFAWSTEMKWSVRNIWSLTVCYYWQNDSIKLSPISHYVPYAIFSNMTQFKELSFVITCHMTLDSVLFLLCQYDVVGYLFDQPVGPPPLLKGYSLSFRTPPPMTYFWWLIIPKDVAEIRSSCYRSASLFQSHSSVWLFWE